MVVCVLCAAGPNGRGVFYVRLGSLVCVVICGRVFGGCLGVVVLACSVRGLGWGLAAWCVFYARLWVYPVYYEVDNSPLFNFNRIFPPFPGACRNLARKPLFFGYNAYAVGLMFGGCGQ